MYAISRVAMLDNVDVAVYSPEGQLIFTATGINGSQGMMNGTGLSGNGGTKAGGAGGSPSPSASAFKASDLQVHAYPLTVGGKEVATVEVYAANHGWCVKGGAVYNEAEAERAWSNLSALYKTARA